MLELIAGIVQLATTVLTFIQTEELVKYVSEMKDIQTQLIDERAKGYNSDDAKIESLYAKFHISRQAFQDQLAVLKPSAVPTAK